MKNNYLFANLLMDLFYLVALILLMFDHSPKPKFFQYPLELQEEAMIRNRLGSLQTNR